MKKYTAKALHPDASELNHEAYKRGCIFFHDENYHKSKLAVEERHGEAIELYEQIPGDSDVYAQAQRNLSIARRSLKNNGNEP